MGLVIGMLGDSPWAAGYIPIRVGISENSMLRELDKQFGIRTEYKPGFLPGLNIGFVLNNFNNRIPKEYADSFMDILAESVVGVAYTHDYFHASLAYRFDSEYDTFKGEDEGADFMYRLEERVLGSFVDGLSIAANGWWRGIGINSLDKELKNYQNWLYINWAPQNFSSQLRFGYLTGEERQEVHTSLRFYYNFFPWLSAGLAGTYYENPGDNKDFAIGSRSVHKFWIIEPQIRVNIAANTYVALVYSYEQGFLYPDGDRKTQFLNLRTVVTF